MIVELTEAAERDLVDIYLFGFERYGAVQADSYALMLDQAMRFDLPDQPQIGRARAELGSGVRSIYRGVHHVYHRPSPRNILVLRVLHGRMDVRKDLFQI